MHKLLIFLFLCMGAVSAQQPKDEDLIDDPRIKEWLKTLDRLAEDQTTVDAAWGQYADLIKDLEEIHKMQSFIGMLSNNQISRKGMAGYPIDKNGIFILACSKALNIKSETLIKNFCTPPVKADGNIVIFDIKKLFEAFGTKELEQMAEQVVVE